MAINNSNHSPYMNGMNQARHRGTAVWYDQHRSATFRNADGDLIFENGRPYYSIIELATRMPVGPVMPLGWEAPVHAPQMYLLKSIGKATVLPKGYAEGLSKSVSTDRIRIDYAQMHRDDTQATQDHWRLAVAEAASRDWAVPEYGAPMDRRLLAIVGPAPRSPKIAEAFMAENPWALGMLMPTFNPRTNRMEVEEDEQLARILDMNRDDLLTPEQAKREADAREAAKAVASPDVLAEAKRLHEEAQAMFAEVKAMLGKKSDGVPPVTAKRGPGRPKKDAIPVEA